MIVLRRSLFLLILLALSSVSLPVFAQSGSVPEDAPVPITYDLQVDIPGFSTSQQVIYGPFPVGCDETVPDTCECKTAMVCVKTIDAYLNSLFRWGAGAGVILAVTILMISGVEWMTGAAVGTIERAKKRAQNAVLGLLFLFGTATFLTFINPNITSLGTIELPVIAASFVPSENTDDDPTGVGTGNPEDTNAVPDDILAIAQDNYNADHPSTMQYFSQRSYSQPYGGCSTIQAAGCGPTSVAMIAKYHGVNVNPVDVAEAFVEQGDRACPAEEDGSLQCSECEGTRWSAYGSDSDFLEANGLTSRQYFPSQRRDILIALAEGKPLLASMGCSRFTTSGHFIVLAGMLPNGTIAVKDPNSSARTTTNVEELWSTIPYVDDAYNCTGKTAGLTALKSAWLIEPLYIPSFDGL